MINKEKIEERKETINNDIQVVKQRLLDYQEKIKEDNAWEYDYSFRHPAGIHRR